VGLEFLGLHFITSLAFAKAVRAYVRAPVPSLLFAVLVNVEKVTKNGECESRGLCKIF